MTAKPRPSQETPAIGGSGQTMEDHTGLTVVALWWRTRLQAARKGA